MKNSAKRLHCCNAEPQKRDHRKVCPVNGQKGQSVASETLRHLIRTSKRAEIKSRGYYFCKSPDCDTVYYHPDSGQCFNKADLKVRVGLKETEDPVWLCYCFGITQKMIWDEIERTGKSASGDRIRREVADGNCDCEILNPSGRCCLGEVRSVESAHDSRR